MISDQAQQQIDHWQHSTRRSATWLTGQGLRILTGTSVAGIATQGMSSLTYVLGSLGIGLSIGVRVFMVNDKHKEDIKFFTSYYRPEVASVLGIDPAQVGEEELRRAAEYVPNIQEALDRADKERNAKMMAWVGGGLLAGLALFTLVVPLLTTGITIAGMSIAGLAIENTAVLGLAAAGVNMAMFPLAKEAVEAGVNRFMHIGEPAAHHYIEAISRDLNKSPPDRVTQEHVFEVFLAANPAMRAQLEGALGTSYDRLDHATHEIILKQYGEVLHLAEITDDLNRKLIRPQELAFITSGMSSGVPRLDTPPVSGAEQTFEKIEQKIEKSREKARKALHDGKEKWEDIRHHAEAKVHAMRESLHHKKPEETDEKTNWQARVGQTTGAKSASQSWGDYTSDRGADGATITPR